VTIRQSLIIFSD